jgi:hypothetical protein
LSELRVKARFGDASSFTSSGSDNFSPNSSTSSTENNNNRSLLIELKQQENQQHVFRPTPLPPLTDVNILSLSSAIASLAKSSPTAASGVQTPATASGLLTSPIGIHNHQQQQQFASNDGLSQPNGCSLFVGQPQPPNNHHQQQPIAIQPSGQQQAELNPATISQRNLQVSHSKSCSPKGNAPYSGLGSGNSPFGRQHQRKQWRQSDCALNAYEPAEQPTSFPSPFPSGVEYASPPPPLLHPRYC